MPKFIPTRRGNPCPVCDDTTGKCRFLNDVVLCMTFADASKGEIHNGHKCLKPDSGKGWSTWKLDNSQEWSEQQRLEWKQKNWQRKQLQAKADEQRRQRSLAAVERDEQYRELLAQLTLHPDDRADLVRRGFSNQQIDLCGFKSVESYHPLQCEFSHLLPGIGATGKELIVKHEGYLCPIRNADGLIVACQVRLRSIPTGESNRYRWLSGQGQSLHLHPDGGKSSGELPLGVFRPEGKPDRIALAEGTGAKPFLVSQRRNEIVVGAAGGQWASSPVTFRQTLDRLALDVGKIKPIFLYPDAGDTNNLTVVRRWKSVVDLLWGWGWSVKFAWWGQFDKQQHQDIDELHDFSHIEYLDPEQFFKLSVLPEQENEPQWLAKAHKRWKAKRKFTPQLSWSSLWCDWEKPEDNSLFFGKAGLGRGKTTRLKRWVEQWKEEDNNSGFLCLGYRNSLLLQLCKKLGFYHLHEHNGMVMRAASNEGIALCLDSLWRFKPEDFDQKILILDEAKSVIKHLLCSSTIKGRDKIINLFSEAIKRSKLVVCLDGLMTDWVVNYIKALAPEKQVVTAENTFKGGKSTVHFLLGAVGEKALKTNDRSPWLKKLLHEAPIPAICSDSQALIEALDELLTNQGLKTLRVDSKTVPEKYVKDFLEDCDGYLALNRPDVLLYTPSAESGVDVSITGYFTHHFGFFYGVIDIDGILQMLGRIRDERVAKYVWCKEFTSKDEEKRTNSSFANVIAQNILDAIKNDITTALASTDVNMEPIVQHLGKVIENSNDVHFRASCLIESIEDHEKSNLRKCLKQALLESGYKVNEVIEQESEGNNKRVADAVEAVKRQNAKDIFLAEQIPLDKIQDLKFDARWEERCKVIQARIRQALPGIEQTPIWTKDFIYLVKYDNRNFIFQQEMFWLFHHPEVAKRQCQEKLHWMARRLNTFIGNIKSRWSTIHALHEIGFARFLVPGVEWTDESPELALLIKLAKKHSTALQKSPGKQKGIRYLSSLLGILGLKLKCRKEQSKRFYSLDEEILNDPYRLQTLACLNVKFSEDKPELDWESAINEANGISAEKTAEIQAGQGVEGLARTPQSLYTTNGVPASEISVLSQGDSGFSPEDAAAFSNEGCEGASVGCEGASVGSKEDEESEAIAGVTTYLSLIESKEEYQQVIECTDSPIFEAAWQRLSAERQWEIINLFDASRAESLSQLQDNSPDELRDELLSESGLEASLPRFSVGQRLRGLFGTFAGKVVKIAAVFEDYCETIEGLYITPECIQKRQWELI